MVSHNRAFCASEGQGHALTGSFSNNCRRVFYFIFCREGDIFWTQSLELQRQISFFFLILPRALYDALSGEDVDVGRPRQIRALASMIGTCKNY